MPRPNDYPRWRFIAMQTSMWGILLCAVGVAAITSHYRRGSAIVKLGEPLLLDSISVRLPKGWKISNEGSDGVRAVERAELIFQRIIVVRELDPENLTLIERFMQGATPPAKKRNLGNSSIKLGPVQGVVNVTRIEHGDGEVSSLRITASAVMPDKHEVTIAISCYDFDGSNEERTIELLKLVAESVKYTPAMELK